MRGRIGGLLRKAGKAVYVAFILFALGYGAFFFYEMNQKFWLQLLDVRPNLMAVVAISSICFVHWMDKLDAWVKGRGWAWTEWSVFRRNINFVPMDYPVIRVPFLALLYFNLPILAWVEEMMFRHSWIIHPTAGFWDALWRSALFGIIHVAGGAKLRTALPLAVLGLWLSWHYMYGGVETATISHLAMNTFGLTSMLVGWWRTGKNPFRE